MPQDHGLVSALGTLSKHYVRILILILILILIILILILILILIIAGLRKDEILFKS